MEPTCEEALDVNDSDLRSSTVLRPCKQQRRRDETNPTTNTPNLAQSQTLVFSQSPFQTPAFSQLPSQTVNSLPQNLTSAHQTEAPLPFRTIPGPAGIIQAAKIRKMRDNERFLGQEDHPMVTQDYIRKVVEDPEEDNDFKRSPWLSAIEFAHADDLFNPIQNAPLGKMKDYQKNGKLDQVVAVIKSCTPNALGDLAVTLKDPTGTVSGTVHHKVLTESEFAKGISVGSVLVLNKVSVFSPSRSAHFLNITNRNLVKVFYKDGGSSRKQTFNGCINTNADTDSDSGSGTQLSHNAFCVEQGAERIMNRIKTITNNKNKQSMHIDLDNEEENINPHVPIGLQFSKTSEKDTNQKIPTDNEILKEADFTKNGDMMFENGLTGTNTVGSLPHWTDEQVQEIGFDLDDDF